MVLNLYVHHIWGLPSRRTAYSCSSVMEFTKQIRWGFANLLSTPPTLPTHTVGIGAPYRGLSSIHGGWCRHCPNKRMSGSLTGDVLLPRFNCGFTSRVAAAGHRRGGSCLHLHRLVHSPEPGRLAHQKGFQLEFSSLYSALKYSIPKPRTSSLLSVFRSCRPNPVSISRKKL